MSVTPNETYLTDQRDAALAENARLREALTGCVEHLQWSTRAGQEAFVRASNIIWRDGQTQAKAAKITCACELAGRGIHTPECVNQLFEEFQQCK